MRLMIPLTCTFLLGIAVGQITLPAVSAQFRSTKTTNLITTDLGSWCEGKEVTVELNEAGPGTSGKHYHPGHSFTWIIEGSEVYTIAGQPPKQVKAGDLLHEEPMQLHTTENQSPVKLLVVRVVEKGKQATVRVP
jgi:quercetin dioxygenase-like cupin family protein